MERSPHISDAHSRNELNPLLDTWESKNRLFSGCSQPRGPHTGRGGGRFLLLFLILILRAGHGWGVGMLAAEWHPGTFWGRRGQRQAAVLTVIRCRQSSG